MESLSGELDLLVKFLLVLVFGFCIGLEREFAGKPAGMRTHMLVALGTTFFVLLGPEMIRFFQEQFPPSQELVADPVRIIEAIMVGISFLGAGTILKNKRDERVENLTTAASIMVMAAIGISVALGKFILATGATAFVLVINHFLLRFEIKIQQRKK